MREEEPHVWLFVNFVYSGWTECTCGFRPNNQKEMDEHTKATRSSEASLSEEQDMAR